MFNTGSYNNCNKVTGQCLKTLVRQKTANNINNNNNSCYELIGTVQDKILINSHVACSSVVSDQPECGNNYLALEATHRRK